jgi:hypothetical protein
MLATAETINFEADLAANANVPALHARPFDYNDVGSKAVPWAVERHPYEGPTLADTSTSLTPEQVQACVNAALARPEILNKPGIYKAGIRTKQGLRGEFEYPGLPDYCTPDYLFQSSGYQEIMKGGRWVRIKGAVSGARGNQRQRVQLLYTPTHPNPAYVYDECIGGKFEKSRFTVTNMLKAGQNGSRKSVAQKSYVLPVSVHGNCQAAVRSREHYANS